MTWPFGDLKMFGYGALLIDPPWRFSNYSAKGEAKNPSAHYACMSLDDLKAMPVRDLAMTLSEQLREAGPPTIIAALEAQEAGK